MEALAFSPEERALQLGELKTDILIIAQQFVIFLPGYDRLLHVSCPDFHSVKVQKNN
jgi:hypothetical protein